MYENQASLAQWLIMKLPSAVRCRLLGSVSSPILHSANMKTVCYLCVETTYLIRTSTCIKGTVSQKYLLPLIVHNIFFTVGYYHLSHMPHTIFGGTQSTEKLLVIWIKTSWPIRISPFINREIFLGNILDNDLIIPFVGQNPNSIVYSKITHIRSEYNFTQYLSVESRIYQALRLTGDWTIFRQKIIDLFRVF